MPDVTYFSVSKDIGGYTWKTSDFAINANVHYNLEMEGSVKPYVGGGLGLNMFSFSTPTFNFLTGDFSLESQTYTRIGINLLVGANYKMNDQMTLFLEPRYVLASDFNNLQIKVGASFALK